MERHRYHVNGKRGTREFSIFSGFDEAIKVLENSVWRGILDKMLSDRIVRCITGYAVMSYLVMLYCNRSTVISYSVTL